MPTNKPRLQVILGDAQTNRVKQLADERGLSVSAMCSQLINAALRLDQFQSLENVRGQYVEAAIHGADISDFKLQALLKMIDEID